MNTLGSNMGKQYIQHRRARRRATAGGQSTFDRGWGESTERVSHLVPSFVSDCIQAKLTSVHYK